MTRYPCADNLVAVASVALIPPVAGRQEIATSACGGRKRLTISSTPGEGVILKRRFSKRESSRVSAGPNVPGVEMVGVGACTRTNTDPGLRLELSLATRYLASVPTAVRDG